MSRPVTLGVLSPFFGGEYLGEIVAQLFHSAQTHGVRMIAVRTGDVGRFDLPVALAHIDGWIVVLNAITPGYLAQIIGLGKPVVSIGYNFGDSHVAVIESDNEGSTAEAVGRLIQAGHRHIAYIGYLTEYDIGLRLAGYRRGLASHGLAYRPEYVFNTGFYGQAGGSHAAQEILTRRLPVTAVIAGTDRSAVGAITRFQEGGKRVPEDIAVIGYDNSAVAITCVPPLASIDQNLDQIAERAVTVVLEQIQNSLQRGGRELVANTFIPRQSCGLSQTAPSLDWRPEAHEMIGADKDPTTIYELGRHLVNANPESIHSLMKLLVPHVEWRCVGKWDDPVAEPDVIAIRDVYHYTDGHTDDREIRCNVTAFPPLSTMGMAEDFDPQHFICVLPVLSGQKRLRIIAVSGVAGATRPLAGILQYLDLLAPAFERTALDEELAVYQAGLEELVRQRTAELTIAKQRAEAANQAKSSFLASMSHELRTPLNAILGYAQILKQDKSLDDRQRKSIGTIERSGDHLLTLINDILDLAKIEAGKVELGLSAINLSVFLRVIDDVIRIKAEERSLLFACEVSPLLPRGVQADEKRLRQVLLNLLSNAVKFTHRGQVSLRVQPIAIASAEAKLRFEVQDTGVGISQTHLESIFQPFEQVGDIQQRVGGTGLGLAISRQLVRLMGGDIHVDSKEGEGSLFWFELCLPIVEAEAVVAANEAHVTGYLGPRKKVLVVDDDVANRAIIVQLLSSLDFEMFEAENGHEGLVMAQAHVPDLILMDNVMPVMSGLESTRLLREMSNFKQVPIIAASASASDADRASSLAMGANIFLSKPIDLNQLIKHVGELLQLTWIYELPEGMDVTGDEGIVTEWLVLPPI